MKASKGTGKDQPKTLIIETPTGPRMWGSIKADDYVFALDGTPTKVTKTYDQGIQQTYKITFDDGSYTYCGQNHLWSVQGQSERSKNIFNVLTTQQIIDRGVRIKNGKWKGRQFEIPLHDSVQFPKAVQSLDAYVLGIWLGDGCRTRGIFTGTDEEVKTEIISRGYYLGKDYQQSRTIYGITPLLENLGILNCYSYQKFIPDSYKYASIKQREDLLSGLMDTDGTVDKNGAMEFDTTSEQLAKDVVWLIRSLGGNAFIKASVKKPFYYKNNHKILGKDCYRVTVRLKKNPFLIKRKADRFTEPKNKSQLRYLKRYIDKIELDKIEETMCIEVEHSSHCYLTNDFIVTHNTCTEAWLCWNFLLTRPHPKIAATSISADNLSDNLWTEMAHWQNKSKLLSQAFTWTKTRIFATDHPETWWMSARTWNKSADKQQQSATLAGLHAEYIMFVLDESGGIPDAVMASAEAALSTCTEGHLLQGGNPTNLDGPLYRACTSERNLWKVYEMTGDPDDPNRSARVSVEWARSQIEKYGKDNPWVLVNVFGKFPPSSFNALIGPDELQAAVKRRYRPAEFSAHPMILGIDVARFGDDSSIIFPRQGLQAFNPFQYRNLDGTQGAEHTIHKWNDLEADACFIDNTGGFGASWIDNLYRLGKSPIGVHFSQDPISPKYYNKRAEIVFECIEWIKRGGALPDIPELINALTVTTYTFKGDKLLIEPKEDVKQKLNGMSPDHMDALCLTFSMPVEKINYSPYTFNTPHQFDYDPFSRDRVRI